MTGGYGGVLVAVITGGRPKLGERPTARFLESLQASGFTQIAWVMHERDAEGYERDEHEVVTYDEEWAHDWAASHWFETEPPKAGGFYGAFVGREAACREAERRGCWAVLQLDDNINVLSVVRGSRAGQHVARDLGGMGRFAQILADVTASTNGRMVGAQLQAVASTESMMCRPGFPYSCFVERVGEGREPWWGPFEDDISHALQYGQRADGATALVVPSLNYKKESKSKTGMRANYNHARSRQLQAIFPHAASVGVRAAKANGMGGPRVFHKMGAGAVRNPLVVRDWETYNDARAKVREVVEAWHELEHEYLRVKVDGWLEARA